MKLELLYSSILIITAIGVIIYFTINKNNSSNESINVDTVYINSLVDKNASIQDSLTLIIDSLVLNKSIRDTTIIINKYEKAKDGIIVISNDSLYQLIFAKTEHL